MKIRKLFAAVLALCLAACMIPTAFADEPTTIKIGVIGPMTGAAAVYGNAVANGAQIAVDKINAAGGAYRVELNVQDDEHDPEKGINAYNVMKDSGVQMILGTVTTAPCLAVSVKANEDRMFMLTPSASAADVTANKNQTFQVCFTDPGQGVAAANMIAEQELGEKVGIIYNNADVYSTGIFQAFVAQAEEIGLEIVAITTFAADDNVDFSVQIAECKNNDADLVFLPIYYTPASLILAQSAAVDYEPTFFGVDGMDGILTLEGFDTDLAEGVMLLTPFAASSQDEMTQEFVTDYVIAYGEEPNQFAADAYDGIMALVKACEMAGITSETTYQDACEKLIAVFPELQISGLTGELQWLPTGEVNKTPAVYVIEDGAYTKVEE